MGLKYPKRNLKDNGGFLEEMSQVPNFERECVEERCFQEEMDEIYRHFPNKVEEYKQKWNDILHKCASNKCDPNNTLYCINKYNHYICKCNKLSEGKFCKTLKPDSNSDKDGPDDKKEDD